jgi:hypothetical protein
VRCETYLTCLSKSCGISVAKVAKKILNLIPHVTLPYRYGYELKKDSKLPKSVRTAILDSFEAVAKAFSRGGDLISSRLDLVVDQTGAKKVIELGSGSGSDLLQTARQDKKGIHYIATDLTPQPDNWGKNFKGVPNLSYVKDPVSFQDFDKHFSPEDLKGSIIVATAAFHYLSNKDARAFLEKAAKAGASVVIAEPLDRQLRNVVATVGATVPGFFAPFFAKNLSLKRRAMMALYTWGIPIVPIAFVQEGIAGTLSQRTEADWKTLTEGLPYKMVHESGLGPMGNWNIVRLVHE